MRPPGVPPSWPDELVEQMREGGRRLRAMARRPWPAELVERARQGSDRLRAMIETRKGEATHDNHG